MQGYTTSWVVGGSEEGGNTVESFLATKNDRERPARIHIGPALNTKIHSLNQIPPCLPQQRQTSSAYTKTCTKFLSVDHSMVKSTLYILKLEQNYLVYLTA
jgi:hypothetical protein